VTVSLIIPSFRESSVLCRCLYGIKHQTLLPNQLIIIFKKGNKAIHKVITEFSLDFPIPIDKVMIEDMSSLIVILNYGLKMAKGEIVVFTDDDTVPERDWIYKIVNAYKISPLIGGVGGRDVIYKSGKEVEAKKVRNVGKLMWFGRIIGNHHEILDKAQEVDFLKGANMSFKRELLSSLDEKIIGIYRCEEELCFQVKKKGYKLWYDPNIRVKHLKNNTKLKAWDFFVIAHNTTYLLLKYLSGFKKIIFLFFTFFIGQRNNLGLLKTLLSPSIRTLNLSFICLAGKVRGISTFSKNKFLT
jgi:GT2 family glycosyltransferase